MAEIRSDAQAAYAAVRSFIGEPFPEWADLSDEVRAAFKDLAEAFLGNRAAER